MLNNKLKISAISFILLNLIGVGVFSVIVKADSIKSSGTAPMTIVMDGIIDEGEWSNRDWKVGYYLDINESNAPDSDGLNYLYLGEDVDNLYIGLDLCSDKTPDITDEWVGVWLNTNNRSFGSIVEWANYLNDGTESLLHDVEINGVYPFFTDERVMFTQASFFKSDNQYNVIYGNIEGDYTLLNTSSGQPYFNFTSVQNNMSHSIWVDFSIDMKDYFPVFPNLFADNILEVEFQIYSRVNDSITENKLIFWYNNGTLNEDDTDQVVDLNDNTSWIFQLINYDAGNLTTNNLLKFSLYANHSAPFKIQMQYFYFGILPYQMNDHGAALIYPYSSITNYQINWSFGASYNNASNHRMYEIQIPKNELEHYNPNEELGIIVGGYGTMSIIGTNFWVFSPFSSSIRHQLSVNYIYFNMLGLLVPAEGAIFGYDLLILIGIISIISVILTKKNKMST